MTASSSGVRVLPCLGVVLLCLSCLTVTSHPSLARAAELPPLTASIPPEEALAAIKRRAQKILEARRKARRLKFSGEVSEAIAYETNPSNSSSRKGDTSFDQSAYLSLSKKLTSTLNWSSTYSGSYLKYLDYGDGDYTDHIITPTKLRWQPGRMWRVESWTELEYNFYPTGNDSSYRNYKLVGRVRQNLFGTWFQQFQYEGFLRDYTRKKARDGAGNNTRNERKDMRHRLRYKVGTTVKKALFSVENEYYWNDSNDARNDFYDYQVWKINNSISGNMTKKLYVSGGMVFEQKNYEGRQVSGITAESRYDGKYSFTGSASYDVNDTWRLGYDFSFDHLDSNDPTGEFDNAKHSFKVTAKF